MYKHTGCVKKHFDKAKLEQPIFGKTTNVTTMIEKIQLEKAKLMKAMLEKAQDGKRTRGEGSFENSHLGQKTNREVLLDKITHREVLSDKTNFEKLSSKQHGSVPLCVENFGFGMFVSEKLSFEEFCSRFHSEEVCIEALFKSKWPNGYCCPRCGYTRACEIRTRRLPLYECLVCHYQVSLIKDTVMEGSRTSLIKWFQAIFLLACPHMVMNAVKLAAAISVTYKTAWLILHKLRFIIIQANASMLLEGTVRVNAAVYGRPYNPTVHRHKQEHPLLVGASLDPQGELTHIKIKQLLPEHLSPNGVLRYGTDHFVKHNVSSSRVSDIAIETRRYYLRGYQPLLLCCKRASNWMNEVYHGIGPKHLQAYLDEFCFHWNHPMQNVSAINRLFQLAASTKTITYATLTRNDRASLKQALNSSAA